MGNGYKFQSLFSGLLFKYIFDFDIFYAEDQEFQSLFSGLLFKSSRQPGCV